MIISRLIGGLGNQMFQYAVGRDLAKTFKCKLMLDISGFNGYKLHNGYELNTFNINADIASNEDVEKLVNAKSTFMRYVCKRLKISKNSHFIEQGFAYDSTLSKIESPIYLDGYWQSYKYFSNVEVELRNEFIPKKPLMGLNLDLAKKILDVNSVSIHIRRGDYVNNVTTNKTHGFLGENYYKRSINIINDRVIRPFFFVFSDDINWAKENLGLKENVIFVEHNKGHASYEDMRLMSLCKHHIIANSSFSWWGAWLGGNASKTVLYPDRWFATDERDTSTLCPPEWESVKV